ACRPAAGGAAPADQLRSRPPRRRRSPMTPRPQGHARSSAMRHVPWLIATMLMLCPHPPAIAAAPASTPAARRAIDDSVSAALQGDVRRSLQALAAVPAPQFAGRDADYRACLFGRFERSTPPYLAGAVEDPFAREALAAYQDYWW